MAMPELTAESPHNSSGNYGMLDQINALRWIRDNIKHFGTMTSASCLTIARRSLPQTPLMTPMLCRIPGPVFPPLNFVRSLACLRWHCVENGAEGAVDSPRVTIAGESAGAYDIAALLGSPLATGLFDGAIMESTCTGWHPPLTAPHAAADGIAPGTLEPVP